MATRGRPKAVTMHKVQYHTPKAELALKAHQRLLEGRLKAGYTELFKLAYQINPTNVDLHMINVAVKEGLELI